MVLARTGVHTALSDSPLAISPPGPGARMEDHGEEFRGSARAQAGRVGGHCCRRSRAPPTRVEAGERVIDDVGAAPAGLAPARDGGLVSFSCLALQWLSSRLFRAKAILIRAMRAGLWGEGERAVFCGCVHQSAKRGALRAVACGLHAAPSVWRVPGRASRPACQLEGGRTWEGRGGVRCAPL